MRGGAEGCEMLVRNLQGRNTPGRVRMGKYSGMKEAGSLANVNPGSEHGKCIDKRMSSMTATSARRGRGCFGKNLGKIFRAGPSPKYQRPVRRQRPGSTSVIEL